MILRHNPNAGFILCMVLILFFSSCEKNEGTGGNSHINGTVIQRTYLRDLSSQPIDIQPAKDKDVFLMFGNERVVGKDVETSFNGSYEFNYLWPGDYTIYVYSDSALNKSTTEVVKTVNISKGKTVTLDTIYVNKIVDWDDGNSSLSGTVIERTYNEDFSILLSEVPAKDEDVFLSFSSTNKLIDDVETSFTGQFDFFDLWAGDYNVYCYSDTSLNGGEVETVTQVSIADYESKDIGVIYVDKVADWDDGSASIKGKVMVSYYSGSIVTEVSPGQDLEVYISYNGHDFYDKRIRTGYDGTFSFNELILGDYTVYVYSEVVGSTVKEDEIVSMSVTITETDQVIDLGKLFVNNR